MQEQSVNEKKAEDMLSSIPDVLFNAEHLEAECQTPHCNNGHLGSNLQTICPDCKGSGKRWLLRAPHWRCSGKGHYFVMGTKSTPLKVECCSGWLPVTDLGLVLEAIRLRGGSVQLFSFNSFEGDWVTVIFGDGEAVGEVRPKDGLRGSKAVDRALRLALEATDANSPH